MPHFTYSDPKNDTLSQGDIIRRTDELLNVITEVHPYFANNNYSHFIILTQSCDLQRRDGKNCKSRYITIAAVRSLEECLKREVEPLLSTDIEKETKKIIDDRKRDGVKQTIIKLLNNNHPDYFYLHSSLEHGITDSLVAFLRVSIALKADQHYKTLLDGKILELKDEFKAKLGWLVGNLYSRVGTNDWVPNAATQSQFEKMVNGLLDENFLWLKNLKDTEKEFKRILTPEQIAALTEDELVEKLKGITLPTKKDKVITKLQEILEPYVGQDIKKVLLKIQNDKELSTLLK